MYQISQYDQTDFERKKAMRNANESEGSRWGDRVDLAIKQIELLKLDADPSWDVFNHLDAAIDRLTEAMVYANPQEDEDVNRPNWRKS